MLHTYHNDGFALLRFSALNQVDLRSNFLTKQIYIDILGHEIGNDFVISFPGMA